MTYWESQHCESELQKAYEGRTTTEFYALLDSTLTINFDDRKTTIDEHITSFERAWNAFVDE